MADEKEESGLARRDFFKAAGLGLGASVIGMAAAGPAAAATGKDSANAGYRETPHIRTYYDLARA